MKLETRNSKLDTGKIQDHTLGLDLAGSLTATGAVGAVLSSTFYSSPYTLNHAPYTLSYLYDKTGNFIATANSAGKIKDKINYSPFGELLSSSDANLPFTFSTKTVDASGLSYYGFRSYNAGLGRWLTRDPIKEKDNSNIYCFRLFRLFSG